MGNPLARQRRQDAAAWRSIAFERSWGLVLWTVQSEKNLEHARLMKVASSIQRNGFDPDAFGDIEGYTIGNDTSFAFFIRGGKHRAAALTFLGYEFVPVRFRASFPKLVTSDTASVWPLVREGKIRAELAQNVLSSHIAGRGMEQLGR